MLLGREKFPEILKLYEGKVEVVFRAGFSDINVGFMEIKEGEVVNAVLDTGGRSFKGEEALKKILSGDFLFRVELLKSSELKKPERKEEEGEKEKEIERWKKAVSTLRGGGSISRKELLRKLGIREPSDEEIEKIIDAARG